MNQLTSESSANESVLFRPVLESLEPRRLLSVATPEPVISIAEFSFGASGGSSSMTVMPVHVDYHPFAAPPLSARRFVESFSSPFGDRDFSVMIFVTPWSAPSSTTQTPATSTADTKLTTSDASSDAKQDASPQIPTLALDDTTEATRALPSIQPQTDPRVFATKVVEEVDPTPHATEVKHSNTIAPRSSELSPLEQLQREDELIEARPTARSSRPWYQVLDREVLHRANHASDKNNVVSDRTSIITRPSGQAESLRTLAIRAASEQKIASVLHPVTASTESTSISIWQRVAMVTLTGGALVANWYVRRRRAKLALSGLDNPKVGKNPFLP